MSKMLQLESSIHTGNTTGTKNTNGKLIIKDLSDDILEKIFHYFGPRELLENVCLVCMRWRLIAEKMAKSVRFENIEASTVLQFISRFPNTVECITLKDICGSIAVILKKLRRKQKYLKQIHIDSCEILPSKNPLIAGWRLRNLIEVCRYLKKLSLTNVELRVDDLLDAVPLLENLRALSLGGNPLMKPVDVITIVMNCENLQSLTLYQIDGMKDQDLKFILSNDRLIETLQELSLDQVTELTSVAYQYILHCRNLKKLHINCSTGFSADTLMEIPTNLPLLKSLTIEKTCRIRPENLCEFFKNSALELNQFGLTDCCCHFHDDCLGILVAHQSHHLIHLALRNCLHLKDVSEIFEKCKFLRTLDLSGCEILKAGINFNSKLFTNLLQATLPSHLNEQQGDIQKSVSANVIFKNNVTQKGFELEH